jgi:hypothetical protein
MGYIILTFFISMLSISCISNPECSTVIITQQGTLCSTWGINVNGQAYPSNDIPPHFQQEGLQVCAEYELYADSRLCPCCGGTWATIKTISLPKE